MAAKPIIVGTPTADNHAINKIYAEETFATKTAVEALEDVFPSAASDTNKLVDTNTLNTELDKKVPWVNNDILTKTGGKYKIPIDENTSYDVASIEKTIGDGTTIFDLRSGENYGGRTIYVNTKNSVPYLGSGVQFEYSFKFYTEAAGPDEDYVQLNITQLNVTCYRKVPGDRYSYPMYMTGSNSWLSTSFYIDPKYNKSVDLSGSTCDIPAKIIMGSNPICSVEEFNMQTQSVFKFSDIYVIDASSGDQLKTIIGDKNTAINVVGKNEHLTYNGNNLATVSDIDINVIEEIKVDGTALSITDKSVNIDLSNKVDKVSGKALSTNDYTDAEKTKLTNLPTNESLTTVLNGKISSIVPGTSIAVDNTDPQNPKVSVTGVGLDYKGSMTTWVAPATPEVGDMWWVIDQLDFQIYNGTSWDKVDFPTQVQSDWNVTNTADVNFIKNKPNLATVATSGSYNDLSNKPVIPSAQVQSDYAETDNSKVTFITNKPDLTVFAKTADLAAVATSGKYTDLTDKPVIPAEQVNSDWTEVDTTKKSFIQNKPTLFDGDYNSLTNKPNIIDPVNADWNSTTGLSEIKNKPTLANVATSGDYNELINKPTIPAAQVQSDWNAISGVSMIANKPTIPAAQVNSDWSQTNTAEKSYILNKPELAAVATSGSYTDLSDKPEINTAQIITEEFTYTTTNVFTLQKEPKSFVHIYVDNAAGGFDIIPEGKITLNGKEIAINETLTNGDIINIKYFYGVGDVTSYSSDYKNLVNKPTIDNIPVDGNLTNIAHKAYRSLQDGTTQTLELSTLTNDLGALVSGARGIGAVADANGALTFIFEKSASDINIASITYAADTRVLTVKKGDSSEVTVTLPSANSTASGLMTKEDVATLLDVKNKVENLVLGGAWRATYSTKAEMDAATSTIPSSWLIHDYVYVLVDETHDGKETSYILEEDATDQHLFITFRKIEDVPIITATNLALGVVKGSANSDGTNIINKGKVYVESDGSMSLIGWDALNTTVTAKADKVSNATDGNFASLDATGNLKDSGKKSADFAAAASTINTVKIAKADGTTTDYTPTANAITLPAYPTSVNNLTKYRDLLENVDILDWILNTMSKVDGLVIVETGAGNTNVPEHWMKLEVDRRYADNSFITVRATGVTGNIYLNSYNTSVGSWFSEWSKLAKSTDYTNGENITVLADGTNLFDVINDQPLNTVRQYRGANILNAPYESGNVWLQIHRHVNSGWTTVIAHMYADNSDTDYHMWIRHRANGNWMPWKKIMEDTDLATGTNSVVLPETSDIFLWVNSLGSKPGVYYAQCLNATNAPVDNWIYYTAKILNESYGTLEAEMIVTTDVKKYRNIKFRGAWQSWKNLSEYQTYEYYDNGVDILELAVLQDNNTERIYRVAGGAPNAPEATGDWLYTVKTIDTGGAYFTITAEAIANGTTTNAVYTGHKKANVWSGWKKLATTTDLAPAIQYRLLPNDSNLKTYCDSLAERGTYTVSVYSSVDGNNVPLTGRRWICNVNVLEAGRYTIIATTNDNNNNAPLVYTSVVSTGSTNISWVKLSTSEPTSQVEWKWQGTPGYTAGGGLSHSLYFDNYEIYVVSYTGTTSTTRVSFRNRTTGDIFVTIDAINIYGNNAREVLQVNRTASPGTLVDIDPDSSYDGVPSVVRGNITDHTNNHAFSYHIAAPSGWADNGLTGTIYVKQLY